MRRGSKIAVWSIAGLLSVVAAGFALLQTGSGKHWLAATIGELLSSPTETVKVEGIDGLPPFDMRIRLIALGDAGGDWLTVDNARLAWSPSALLRGRLRIDHLTAASIQLLRQPAPSQKSASPGLTFPRLPVTIDLRDLSVDRLGLSPAIAGGDNAQASIAAHGLLTGERAELTVKLTRIDGQPGTGALDLHYDHPADALTLKFDLEEPTGVLLDAALGRTDHLPLRLTLDGAGPLSGWKGQFHLASGQGIHSDAAVEIDHTTGTRVALKGAAAITPLLAENLRPLVGDNVTFDIAAAEDGKGGAMLAPSRIALASVTITGEGSRSDRGLLDGKAQIAVPDTSVADRLLGAPSKGQFGIDITLSGTADKPKLTLAQQGQFTFGDLAIDGLAVRAEVDGKPGGAADDPLFDLTVDAKAEALRDSAAGTIYGPLSIHFAGTTDAKGALVDIAKIAATGSGFDVKGAGSLKNGVVDGKISLAATDLAVIGKIFSLPVGGAVNFDIVLKTDRDRTVRIQANGSVDKLRTSTPALDALLSGGLAIDVAASRTSAGRIAIGKIVMATDRARLDGSGSFDPNGRTVAGNVTATLTDLKALSSSRASGLTGSGKISATVGGTLEAPDFDARATLDRVGFGATRIDHFEAAVRAPEGLKAAATIKGRVESGKLDETIDAAVSKNGAQTYRLERLHLTGTGGTVDAALAVDPTARRVSGKLNAATGDLSVWAGIAAQQLAGKLMFALELPADGRPGPVRARLDGFVIGAAPSSIGISSAALTGSLSGDFARQSGVLDLALRGLSGTGGTISTADAHVSAEGKVSDFRLHAAGRAHDPFAVDLAGSATLGADANTLRLATLTAKVGQDSVVLAKPVTITVGSQSYRVTDLALTADGGAIEGDIALSGKAVAADLRLRQLPLHPLALLAGRPFVGGTVDGRLTLSGTPQRPQAHLALATKGLDIETDGPLPRPSLDLTVGADWRGERTDLNVRAVTGSGEVLTLTGSAPLAFDLETLQPGIPRNAMLALAVKGGGRLENLSSIVPLGEDRIAGTLTVDIAVGGTIASPRPSGRVALTAGRYANMALGTELDDVDLAVTSIGDRLVLDHLSATDNKSGKVSASGAADFSRSPANVAFNLGFTDFLVARGDGMTIDADGDLKLSGTLKAMSVSGKLGVRRAELYIPDRLPASVVALDVTEIGGRGKGEAPKSAPLAPVSLQVALDAPGQIFVRGHGVNSEWRGHVDIGGTTAGPVLAGQLSVNNGTIGLLGQTFNIDRGTIGFDSGTPIDPTLNVQASANASSVTALVNVTGTARAPKIALSSTPVLPRDEILARVLFGANVGSLTPSQGIQLAAAAATLAQGGPGIMDRVRSTIGLDRLDLSAGGANASGTQGAAKGTTVTGGKYIANGVFVGVAQGLSGNSSQAKVEIEVTPNISVNSTFGTASGSGFGAKYSIDY